MDPKQKFLRISIVLVPLIAFLLSLTQDALITEDGENTTLEGKWAFLMGATAILGGGTLEWIVWLANPIAAWACIQFLSESKLWKEPIHVLPGWEKKSAPSSQWKALLATAIGWSFSLWNEILISESGAASKIMSLEPGYWLWVSSLTTLAIGINLYHFRFTNTGK